MHGHPTNQWMLWSRFAALNAFGCAALAVAWLNGWVDAVVAADTSRITLVIFALFVVGLVATGWRIDRVTTELDHIARGQGGRLDAYRRALAAGGSRATRALELRLFGRITFIRHIANALVMLGLIGTVVGFVIALSGIEPEAAADASQVAGMVGTLVQGLGVALYTTLVGAVLNLWLSANYQILATGTANLAATLIDHGSDLARDGGAGKAAGSFESDAVGRPAGGAAHV